MGLVAWGLGLVVALSRVRFQVSWGGGWWLLPVLMVVMAAIALVRLQQPSRGKLDAHLDASMHAGGLFMAGRFEGEVRVPSCRWPWGRIRHLGVAMAFLLAAWFGPNRFFSSSDLVADRARQEVLQALHEQVAAIEESNAETDQVNQIRTQLQQLQESGDATDAAFWEGRDFLHERMRSAARSAAAKLDRAQVTAAALSHMLERLSSPGSSAQQRLWMQFVDQWGKERDRQALLNELLAAAGIDENSGELDRALRDALEELELRELRLADMSLIDKTQPIDADALREYLRQARADGDGLGEALCLAMGVAGGSGGDLGEGDPVDIDAALQKRPMPSLLDPSEGVLVGVSYGEPQEIGRQEAGYGGLDAAESGVGRAHRQRVLPRYRPAVRGYFERKRDD